MTTGLQVLIGGVDYTSGPGYAVEATSLRLQEDVVNQQWQAALDLYVTNHAIAVPHSNVSLQVLVNGAVSYAGVIADVGWEELVTPTTLKYAITAGNYRRWFDRHLVAETYPSQNADAIVKAVVANYCPGFTSVGVQAAPIVAEYTANDDQPSAVIDALAKQLSWGWYIDYTKDVHFYETTSIASPLPGNLLNADATDATGALLYGDLRLRRSGSQQRNRVKAKGYTQRSAQTVPYAYVGDAQTTTFTLPQQPAGTSAPYFPQPSGSPGVDVGGTLYTPVPDVTTGMAGSSGPPGNTYAYVNIENSTVRFDVAPAAGIAITGLMYYAYEAAYTQSDPVLIQAQAALEGTDGVYEYAFADPRMSADDSSVAQAEASLLIAEYGTEVLLGSFTSFVQGWQAGQSFTLQSATRMGGINQKMYVTMVTRTLVNHPAGGGPLWRYELQVCDRPYVF